MQIWYNPKPNYVKEIGITNQGVKFTGQDAVLYADTNTNFNKELDVAYADFKEKHEAQKAENKKNGIKTNGIPSLAMIYEVYRAYAFFSNQGVTYVSQVKVATKIRRTERSVQLAIKFLRQNGFIITYHRYSGSKATRRRITSETILIHCVKCVRRMIYMILNKKNKDNIKKSRFIRGVEAAVNAAKSSFSMGGGVTEAVGFS